MAEFYNNSLKYYSYMKNSMVDSGHPAESGPTPTAPVAIQSPQAKETPAIDLVIEAANAKFKAETPGVNLDCKRLKFLAFILERIYEANGHVKALISLAEFHLRTGDAEKAARYLEQVVYSADLTEEQKRAHNSAIEACRALA